MSATHRRSMSCQINFQRLVTEAEKFGREDIGRTKACSGTIEMNSQPPPSTLPPSLPLPLRRSASPRSSASAPCDSVASARILAPRGRGARRRKLCRAGTPGASANDHLAALRGSSCEEMSSEATGRKSSSTEAERLSCTACRAPKGCTRCLRLQDHRDTLVVATPPAEACRGSVPMPPLPTLREPSAFATKDSRPPKRRGGVSRSEASPSPSTVALRLERYVFLPPLSSASESLPPFPPPLPFLPPPPPFPPSGMLTFRLERPGMDRAARTVAPSSAAHRETS
mmetsp:Transcript_17801/g.55310  ORF Transcript_17801/g.55310 Transcript_17801/m.55310 type:complete len:284 (+) Transcript_17801:133-984(+)